MRQPPIRRRARLVLAAAALAAAGCGAGAGDPAGEAEAIVETCRTLQVRHLGRVVDGPSVDDARRFLEREPGDGPVPTVTGWLKRVCPRSPDDLSPP